MTLFEKRDRIIKDIFKPRFKESGFSVSGTTFIKKEKDFWKIFNIQSSSVNSEKNVSFYLNIGFLFPIGFELRNQQVPRKPKDYDCQFHIRTNCLTGRNQSYDINDSIEELLSNDISGYILPFFNRYNFIQDCLNLNVELPESWTDCRPYIGLTFIRNGDIEKGNEIINLFIQTTSKVWANEVDRFRNSLITKAGS